MLLERAGIDKMDYCMFRRKWMLREARGVLKATVALYSHSFLLFSASFSQSLVFYAGYAQKQVSILDIVGLSQAEV